MSAWMIWLSLAGLVVILELFTGTFYLLMIAIGLVAGALTALFHGSSEMALIVAAIVGLTTTIVLHKSKYGWKPNKNVGKDPNMNMDIGQTITVNDWQDQGNGRYVARAMYRGAMWDVELEHAAAYSGVFVIQEMQGSRLLVKPS
jgi:membrane protein implicated in regulation of membrane protease activity